MRRVLVAAGGAGALVALLAAVATLLHLEIPQPTGQYPVGRTRLLWTDESRPESHTGDPSDRRQVAATIWYPAKANTGEPAFYLGGGDRLAQALRRSGEVPRAAIPALRFVRDPARDGAAVSDEKGEYPVILLSPGNATNVAFYSGLAEDLASHGWVVAGIDHPYQVAAVELSDGFMAVYDRAFGEDRSAAEAKVAERVADLRFSLDRLVALNKTGEGLFGRIDLSRTGIMGHSNGGIAAVETCRVDARFDACMNIDGQMAGGPFSFRTDAGPPDQPFLYLTKETVLHPELASRFEAGGAGTYRVVLPAAAHDHFADGALFRPTLNPFSRLPDDVLAAVRGFTRSFFATALLGESESVLGSVETGTDVFVNVYPLGAKPPIPLHA